MDGPPDVLIIMADQLRFDAIGAHGSAVAQTPHLDRLVASGTTFTRAYTESPVCVPARAAMLTGKLPHRTGVLHNEVPLADGTDTFIRHLSGSGIRCEGVGKMHFSPPEALHGFDRIQRCEEIPEDPSTDHYRQHLSTGGWDHVLEPHGVRHELYYCPQPSQLPRQATGSRWISDRTIDVLASHSEAQPLLCYSSFIKPHPPFEPAVEDCLAVDPLRMPDPVRSEEERAQLPYHSLAQHRVKWTSPDFDLTRIRTIRAYYHAVVAGLDREIGRILDRLETTGRREQTLVILTADHGEYLGDHWTFGKRGFHDPASRIPLVLSWPGVVPSGKEIEALVGLVDIGPTVMAALDVGLPDDLDGHDLMPLAHGEIDRVRAVHLSTFHEGPLAIHCANDGVAKYVWSAPDDRETLLAVGGDETSDHIDDPAYADRVDALRHALTDRYAEDSYTAPLDGRGGWYRYGRRPSPAPLDDRSPIGRGRQYPSAPGAPPDDSGGGYA